MRRILFFLLISLLAGALWAGCASTRPPSKGPEIPTLGEAARGGGIEFDIDPSVDVSSLTTFRFGETENAGGVPSRSEQIRSGLHKGLGARGYRFEQDGPVDFLVTFLLTVKDTTSVSGFNYHYGGVTEKTHSYREGTLVVGLISTRTKELFWRAWAYGAGEDQTQGHKMIDDALEAMLARVPPRAADDGGVDPSAAPPPGT